MQVNMTFPEQSIKILDEIRILQYLKPLFLNFPKREQHIMPGIQWGSYGQLYTPAYWKAQYLIHNFENDFKLNYRLGTNILEEVVACLLGGFGLKAELGMVAFRRLRDNKQITPGISKSEILESLTTKFSINDREVHYRFPNQKAKFISEFLNRSDLSTIPINDDIALRRWLLTINGIGPKTASWITRNYLDSENVAIIDIHIFRACLKMGLFSQDFDIQKDYYILERLFLDFCTRLDVQPSKMDALIWLQMKDASRLNLT